MSFLANRPHPLIKKRIIAVVHVQFFRLVLRVYVINTILACDAFAVSTCCNALDIIFLAAAPSVAAISLAVTARELE